MCTREIIKTDETFDPPVEYVVISELPVDEREDFSQWIIDNRVNCPIIDNEGANLMDCAFADDYYRFLSDSVHVLN